MVGENYRWLLKKGGWDNKRLEDWTFVFVRELLITNRGKHAFQETCLWQINIISKVVYLVDLILE